MKKIILILSTILLFMGCQKEDFNQLEGTWNVVTINGAIPSVNEPEQVTISETELYLHSDFSTIPYSLTKEDDGEYKFLLDDNGIYQSGLLYIKEYTENSLIFDMEFHNVQGLPGIWVAKFVCSK